MSYQAVAWALSIEGLRAPLKLLLVALADRADENGGRCHPGYTELVRRASMGRRQVAEGLRDLEKLGAIEIQRSGSVGKRRGVNHYKVAVGKAICVAKKAAAQTVPTGTIPVSQGHYPSSPGGTVTTNELPMNTHSDEASGRRPADDARHGLEVVTADGLEQRAYRHVRTIRFRESD